MAEEFHDGGNWCSSSRIALGVESFGWPSDHHMMNMKTTGSGDNESGSASDGSTVLQEMQKPDSILQMMGFTLSPSTATDNWNQDLLNASGSSQGNYYHMLQQVLNSSMNCSQQFSVDCSQIQKDWNSRNISGVVEDSSIKSLKQMNQEPLASITSSNVSTETSRGFSTCLPLNSASNGYTSALVQSLLHTDSQPQQSLLKNSNINFRPTNPSQFSKNTPSWTAASVASNDIGKKFPSTKSQFLPSALDAKPNLPNLAAKANKTARDLNSITNKSSHEPTFKRPRLETPSPLPTFKVRKEKLGDRITALQQLVSPFGKTDTASVLQEVIEYIKFLHDQVSVLSTPYKKNVPPVQRQQTAGKLKNQEGSELDLKIRGLCLVPISSTFLISAENTSDFWTPTFGERFR